MSSARRCPGSATLTFAVRQPSKRASTWGTDAAATAGTVALTGISLRSGAGCGVHPKSIAAASQVDASPSSYSVNGENSVQPSGPSNRAASRVSMPRKRVASGSATTRSVERMSARGGRDAAASLLTAPSCRVATQNMPVWGKRALRTSICAWWRVSPWYPDRCDTSAEWTSSCVNGLPTIACLMRRRIVADRHGELPFRNHRTSA